MAYKRLPGSARQYVDTDSGEIISRRQFENQRAQAAGFSSWSEYQGLRRDQTYMRWLSMHADQHGISERQARAMGSEFNALYTTAANDNWDRDPDGSFADLLVDIGEREDDWEWDVGDTPGNGE